MQRHTHQLVRIVVLSAAFLLPASTTAHPGSGIVIDRLGQIYFVDMVSGVWKVDVHGALTHIAGPGFHWLALDADDRFATTHLPSSGWEVTRLGTHPTLIFASSFPVATGRDGNLYYPSHNSGVPLQILRMLPSGQTSVVATLAGTASRGSLRDINGLAAGPEGSLYYTLNAAIYRISKEGRVSSIVENISADSCASISGIGPEGLPLLRGLDVDSAGTIYVAATGCGKILKVTHAGKVTTLFQVESPWSPTGVVLFGHDVYVLEFLGAGSDDRQEMLPRVRKIAPDGTNRIIANVTHH